MKCCSRRSAFAGSLRHRAILTTLGGLAAIALATAQTPAFSQSPPRKAITNGLIHAEVYLPDAVNGFYRGTRFDWSGVIGNFTYANHSFYNQWFTQTDPTVINFIYRGSEIVAGPASAITGPVEEFVADNGTTLGYLEAPTGGTFIKIGVGILRKPEEPKYDHYRGYEIIDHGKWTVKAKRNSVELTQRLIDKSSGMGYLYRKTIRLVPGSPQMVIEHSLKNLGVHPIDTRVYDHNFLALDHQPTGPDFTVHVPFAIKLARPINTDLGTIEGGTLSYRKQFEGEDQLTVLAEGFSKNPSDYEITVRNTKVNAQVKIVGDRPLQRELIWSIRSAIGVEPFIQLSIAKGQEATWKYTYTYGTANDTKE